MNFTGTLAVGMVVFSTFPMVCFEGARDFSAKREQDRSTKFQEHFYFHRAEKPHPAEWSYRGANGPEHWGDLSKDYHLAKDGKQQSPINLVSPILEATPKLSFDYKPAKINVVYNGHTVEEMEEDGCVSIRGHKFLLKQFHFHAPSEHTVDGKHFAMEMHLVHKDEAGRIAVVGVLIKQGKRNSAFESLWGYLPTKVNKTVKNEMQVNAQEMLPRSHGYYHYLGSLTTPPCTQNVQWYVLEEPIELSKEQIAKFTSIINHNNRPIQPLNERKIVKTK